MPVPEFRNEPLTDFTQPAAHQAMTEALARVRAEFGRHYPLWIGGRAVDTPERIVSYNPGRKSEVVGTVARAGREHAEQALAAAWEAFGPWSRLSAAARAAVLFRAAAIMRRRKLELAAWEVYEAGKTWPEADADVAEAIDFLEYYGRQALRLEEPQPLTPLAGEFNEAFYIPLGAGLVVPPWNFPLAILTGTTAGPVVAGNTVVLKPASNTPIIAAKFMEIMIEAGIPAGVINFLPGPGPEVGDYLVAHPRTRFINFTGSMEVGLRIYEQAARRQPGQIWLKRVVAEMGGKDAIIVDESADLEDAASGIVTSAFGFQGQKCSACSRAIVVDSVYDEVLRRVVEKTQQLRVGQADDPATQVGPVIDQAAFQKIMRYIEIGRGEGRLVAGGQGDDREGYFIQPTVFADVDGRATIAQEEIFGPVVAFIRARDFDHALALANDTMYGLTGSVYARDRYKLERAKREFHVGNLYFNRKCTGALVGVHPFGGWNMSGTDAKAGGPDYLLWFMQPKAVSERL
ncbi:L-glutamate gamma-semialdehyde dehydrogenase [Thermaerobacter subterraneus]|uniref:L-glutamate gamma-semialdehyde dehydrogenase n=1 Tax=Thermaerobacter subterraneus DSM 13965 TaxID=867903 RepID=K6Q1N6_9FIRM|nr:L-glutamate gamma-semialdehyde dehydrogenase [Thermaerobacter subterraneus]EKP94894.1 delta-1-pyrroline-5-carboxylate dehydrogenase [Thermaerobacter subterraneus DSM 13965]